MRHRSFPFQSNSYPGLLSLGFAVLLYSHALAACDGPPENESADSQVAAKAPLSFSQQLQQYFHTAKDTGTTTAASAGHWLAEQYEYASKNASETTGSAMSWLTQQYNHAIEAGDTSAKSAQAWLADDLGKIGSCEYKILRTAAEGKDDFEGKTILQKLNELGRKRWECFSVVSHKGSLTYHLKRPHRSYLQRLPAKELFRLAPLLNFGDEVNK